MRPTAVVIFKLLKAQFLWWGQQLLLYMNCCRHSFSDEATHCCNICMSCCRHSFSDEANSCFQQAVQYEPYSHQLARIQEEEESSNRNSVEKVNHFDMPNLKGQYHEKNMVFYHKKCCFMHNKNYMIFKLSSFRCTGTLVQPPYWLSSFSRHTFPQLCFPTQNRLVTTVYRFWWLNIAFVIAYWLQSKKLIQIWSW